MDAKLRLDYPIVGMPELEIAGVKFKPKVKLFSHPNEAGRLWDSTILDPKVYQTSEDSISVNTLWAWPLTLSRTGKLTFGKRELTATFSDNGDAVISFEPKGGVPYEYPKHPDLEFDQDGRLIKFHPTRSRTEEVSRLPLVNGGFSFQKKGVEILHVKQMAESVDLRNAEQLVQFGLTNLSIHGETVEALTSIVCNGKTVVKIDYQLSDKMCTMKLWDLTGEEIFSFRLSDGALTQIGSKHFEPKPAPEYLTYSIRFVPPLEDCLMECGQVLGKLFHIYADGTKLEYTPEHNHIEKMVLTKLDGEKRVLIDRKYDSKRRIIWQNIDGEISYPQQALESRQLESGRVLSIYKSTITIK